MPGRNRYYKRKLYFSTPDRILLHLLDYVGYEGEFNQPDEMTQYGIAEAIGLGRSTVSKSIRRLERERLVKSARAHVPSGSLRRTVYHLTDAGVSAANRKRIEVEEEGANSLGLSSNHFGESTGLEQHPTPGHALSRDTHYSCL